MHASNAYYGTEHDEESAAQWDCDSMVSINNMVESAIFAQGLWTSDAELQFDLKILRARLFPCLQPTLQHTT